MGGKRVLVVDDDAAIRHLLQDVLVEAGYEVHLASSGNQGLAKVKDVRPDVILLDWLMPDGDGTMFATAYAKMPGPRAPIVGVCASRDAAQWGARIGAAAMVLKPFDVDELIQTVQVQTGTTAPSA